jgi:DNA-binding SARP family transcriptional activator/streptogramin lyase
MEFRILGPLEIVGEDGPVMLHRGKEQALLLFMLLHPNELLPSERLIDELWNGRPPATAPKILQNAVSQLRKALGEGRIETRPPGYVFRLGRDELDLQRFEQLAREGRSEEALALWRGTPLLDLREERFADDARRRLEEQRLAVLEDRIDADLAAARHTEVVPELERLVAEHPLRERLQGQLMRALYGSGRQADALEAYRRARRMLSDELGLEPGPQLQELERKILRQDPDLRAPPRTERPLVAVPSAHRHRRRLAIAAVVLVLVVGALLSLGLIYALDDGSRLLVVKPNSLVAVDPARNRIVGVVPVGSAPRGVAVVDGGVWVANSGEGTVSRIDAKRLKVVQTIGIGAQATELAQAAGAVWVVTGLDNTLVKIDARTGGVLGTLSFPAAVDAAAYAVAAGDAGVWAISGDRLVELGPQTNQIVPRRRLPKCCHGLRDVAVGAGAVWLADTGEFVVRVSPRTGMPTGGLNLGVIPTALAAAYGSVWAASSGFESDRLTVWRIDPQTLRVIQTISIGKEDSFLATVDIAAGAGAIWATNYDHGDLVRIDPTSGSVVARIHIGRHPRGIAVGAHRVWVAVD